MVNRYQQHGVSRDRRCGVLLHPTSLPGELCNGDMGHEAYRFIEFLSANGFHVWQMLPLGPTHEDLSPYQCLSAHAGNPMLISLDWLADRGFLDFDAIDVDRSTSQYRRACLKLAAETFYQQNNKAWMKKLDEFYAKHHEWLDDFALFVGLKFRFDGMPWYNWPDEFRKRDLTALASAKQVHEEQIRQTIFEQFVFFTQWQEIRAYASKFDIELFGDMPIFVARDSAEVWANKDNFLIDASGNMSFVAGVPPDAFSDTGQRWGNPLYDWDYMKKDGFSWWLKRFESQLELFDLLRIDHFRGLQASWYIPATDDTAVNGEWRNVPGKQLLKALFSRFDYLPLVAEDLGVITDEVIELKEHFALPGMRVLQFAYDGNNQNPHLPHSHRSDDVVYTGTHDNDTSLGWACREAAYDHSYFEKYVNRLMSSTEEVVLSLIRQAIASVSFMCVIPMQDILLLDSSARMNIPGTMDNNWRWRFEWDQLREDVLLEISTYMTLYQR